MNLEEQYFSRTSKKRSHTIEDQTADKKLKMQYGWSFPINNKENTSPPVLRSPQPCIYGTIDYNYIENGRESPIIQNLELCL